MRLRHIEIFNAIMITGSVSGAAELINVSQPAASRLLAHAELSLGFALFQRVKGRLIPTAEALALYPRVEHLFANLTDVQRLATNLRAGKSEAVITVLSILTFSHEILPRALLAFQTKHPKVKVSFKALHSPDIVNALALQEADIGFLFSHANHPVLLQEDIAHAHMVCIAPKGMLKPKWLAQKSLSLSDLKTLKMIGLDSADPVGASIRQACEANEVPLDCQITVQTYHGALALAEHGLGAVLIDSCTALSANLEKVDCLPLTPALALPVRALRPASKASSVIVKAFIKSVQQVIQQSAAT
jgi:DNA-binding transcriptional LysR family regulator